MGRSVRSQRTAAQRSEVITDYLAVRNAFPREWSEHLQALAQRRQQLAGSLDDLSELVRKVASNAEILHQLDDRIQDVRKCIDEYVVEEAALGRTAVRFRDAADALSDALELTAAVPRRDDGR